LSLPGCVMRTNNFLKKLLPPQGYKALFTIKDRPYHVWKESIDELSKAAWAINTAGQEVYFALAAFYSNTRRKQDNAIGAKCFWLDVDCGEDKEYKTQREALVALVKFIKQTSLPTPMIVSSGVGLHVYWPVTELVPTATWKKAAIQLKALVRELEFHTDPSRTADIASILRPINTHHRKADPKLVTLLRDTAEVLPRTFVVKLIAACKKYNVKSQQRKQTTASIGALNASLGHVSDFESKPKYAELVADRCAQIRDFREKQGIVDYPTWFGALGVLRHCEDGNTFAHDWSSGHPEYTEADTERKLHEWDSVGPATCAYFEENNADLCKKCPVKGTITSPIQLGTKLELASAPEPVEDNAPEIPDPPAPFNRCADGLYIMKEDIPIKFYGQDLYPARIIQDEHLGEQLVQVVHTRTIEGKTVVLMPLRDLANKFKAAETLFASGVMIPEDENKKRMVQYITGYVAELQKKTETMHLYTSMGWKDHDTKFVIGSHVVHDNGSIHDAGLSEAIGADMRQGFETRGEAQVWSDMTRPLDEAGMEPHAFTLCAGFGAPLMKFTGLEAALVNLLGPSGAGKSTMQRWVNSIYGDFRILGQSHEDTDNAKFNKAALFANLPVTIDEMTNIDSQRLSSFVYRVTQGRDKARLNRSGSQRKIAGNWNTLLISSSNESLLNRLSQAKAAPEAEAMRVFEYDMPRVGRFTTWWGSDVNKMLRGNFGVAGRAYLRHIVKNNHQIDSQMQKLKDHLDLTLELNPEERYWSAVITTTILGGMIAKNLGLIQFDVRKLIPWAGARLRHMRAQLTDIIETPHDILSTYLTSNINSWLVVNTNKNKVRGLNITVVREPKFGLHIRYDVSTGEIAIDRKHFKEFIRERGGDYNAIRDTLVKNGLVKTAKAKRQRIGAGTEFEPVNVWCLVVDAKHPLVSGVPTKVIDNGATEDKANG